jgi:hypothetical protein
VSPVEKRGSRSTTTAVLVALAGVVAGLGLMLFMVNLASRGGESVEVRLGDDRFDAGFADARADAVADGGPILFADVAGGQRDIYLQHIGDDPLTGWYAFAAVAPGKARDCFVEWQRDDELFEDCDGDTFAPDGEGLTAYVVAVEDGRLLIDINADFREDDEEPDAGG